MRTLLWLLLGVPAFGLASALALAGWRWLEGWRVGECAVCARAFRRRDMVAGERCRDCWWRWFRGRPDDKEEDGR